MLDPTDYPTATLRDLMAASTPDLRDWCSWNDPNGDFDADDYGNPLTRADLQFIVCDLDTEQTCGFCHTHLGLSASDADWAKHGAGKCSKPKVAYFPTYAEAREHGRTHATRWPEWRVVAYTRGWAVQTRKSGAYFSIDGEVV